MFLEAYELTVTQAFDDQKRTDREPTTEGSSKGFPEGGNAETTTHSHAAGQDGEAEHEEEAYEEYADAQEYFHTSEDADARGADQVIADDEPESALEVDVIHEGSADPESTVDQECDELRETEVAGDTEAAGPITAPSKHAKEAVSPKPPTDAGRSVPSETRSPIAEGNSAQLGVSEGSSSISCFFLAIPPLLMSRRKTDFQHGILWSQRLRGRTGV
jgi:hypothetical protein